MSDRIIRFPMPKTAYAKKEFAGVKMEPALKARVERVAKEHGLGCFSEAMRVAAIRLCEHYEERPSLGPIEGRRTG